jgi:hypothetical protein
MFSEQNPENQTKKPEIQTKIPEIQTIKLEIQKKIYFFEFLNFCI